MESFLLNEMISSLHVNRQKQVKKAFKNYKIKADDFFIKIFYKKCPVLKRLRILK